MSFPVVGRYNAHDIANFVKESDSSNVRVLHPENFPKLTELKENWFIDFFAPVSLFACVVFYFSAIPLKKKYLLMIFFHIRKKLLNNKTTLTNNFKDVVI